MNGVAFLIIVCVVLIAFSYSVCFTTTTLEKYMDAKLPYHGHVSNHTYEGIVKLSKPYIHFDVADGMYIKFKNVRYMCPSGMATPVGAQDSVVYYNVEDRINQKYGMDVFEKENGKTSVHVHIPVREVLLSKTCNNGSNNPTPQLKIIVEYDIFEKK